MQGPDIIIIIIIIIVFLLLFTGLEMRKYGRKDPSRWPRGTFYPRKLALTSPTSGGLSVGIVRSRTQTTEFSSLLLLLLLLLLLFK
jgi:hypothetical protein